MTWQSPLMQHIAMLSRLSPYLQQGTKLRSALLSGASKACLFSSFNNVIETEAGTTKIQGFTAEGFIINNVQVEGSVLCYSDIWLLWKVPTVDAITPSSLSFVDVVKPSPDVVLLGTGATMQLPPQSVSDHLQSKGIALEVLDTRNAIAYFNFLNEEGRTVLAALLPPGPVTTNSTP